MGDFYVTTYCNFAHDTETGEPIDHECIQIPPEALEAEMDGDYERAIEIMQGKQKKQ
jgi:hypothetical protein